MTAATATQPFDPAAWLQKAEGEHGYLLYLGDALGDGRLRLYVEEPCMRRIRGERELPPAAGSSADLWDELRPLRNERALRNHLVAIGRIVLPADAEPGGRMPA